MGFLNRVSVKTKTLTHIAKVAGVTLLFSGSASAFSLSGLSGSSSGGLAAAIPPVTVGGFCAPGGYPFFVSSQEYQAAVVTEIQQLYKAAYQIRAGQAQLMKGDLNLANQRNQSMVAFKKKLLAEKNADRAITETRTSSSDHCLAPAAAAASANARAAQQQVAQNIKKNLDGALNGVPGYRDALVRAGARLGRGAPSSSLFNATTPQSASDVIESTTVPLAPDAPNYSSDTLKTNTAAARHEIDFRSWRQRMSLAQSALTWIAQQNDPVINAIPFKAMWKAAGRTGNPPGLSPDGNGISARGALKTRIAQYYDSPAWQASLATEEIPQVVRDIQRMQTISTHQGLISLQMAEHIATLSSLQFVTKTEGQYQKTYQNDLKSKLTQDVQ